MNSDVLPCLLLALFVVVSNLAAFPPEPWVEIPGQNLVLVKWRSVAGQPYQVDFSDNLAQWAPLTFGPVYGNGTTNTAVDLLLLPTPITSRFYRVLEL